MDPEPVFKTLGYGRNGHKMHEKRTELHSADSDGVQLLAEQTVPPATCID